MFFMQLSVLDLYTMDYDIFLSLGLYTNLYYGCVLDRRNITCFLAFSLSTYFLRKKMVGSKLFATEDSVSALFMCSLLAGV